MNDHTIIDGIDYGLLAALPGTWKGDYMRYAESTIVDIYDKKSDHHKDLNTLRRVD